MEENSKRPGTYTTRDRFIVEQIIIKDKKIVALSIRNKPLGKRVFLYDIRPKDEKSEIV